MKFLLAAYPPAAWGRGHHCFCLIKSSTRFDQLHEMARVETTSYIYMYTCIYIYILLNFSFAFSPSNCLFLSFCSYGRDWKTGLIRIKWRLTLGAQARNERTKKLLVSDDGVNDLIPHLPLLITLLFCLPSSWESRIRDLVSTKFLYLLSTATCCYFENSAPILAL